MFGFCGRRGTWWVIFYFVCYRFSNIYDLNNFIISLHLLSFSNDAIIVSLTQIYVVLQLITLQGLIQHDVDGLLYLSLGWELFLNYTIGIDLVEGWRYPREGFRMVDLQMGSRILWLKVRVAWMLQILGRGVEVKRAVVKQVLRGIVSIEATISCFSLYLDFKRWHRRKHRVILWGATTLSTATE